LATLTVVHAFPEHLFVAQLVPVAGQSEAAMQPTQTPPLQTAPPLSLQGVWLLANATPHVCRMHVSERQALACAGQSFGALHTKQRPAPSHTLPPWSLQVVPLVASRVPQVWADGSQTFVTHAVPVGGQSLAVRHPTQVPAPSHTPPVHATAGPSGVYSHFPLRHWPCGAKHSDVGAVHPPGQPLASGGGPSHAASQPPSVALPPVLAPPCPPLLAPPPWPLLLAALFPPTPELVAPPPRPELVALLELLLPKSAIGGSMPKIASQPASIAKKATTVATEAVVKRAGTMSSSPSEHSSGHRAVLREAPIALRGGAPRPAVRTPSVPRGFVL
jgi:hypothetical protein